MSEVKSISPAKLDANQVAADAAREIREEKIAEAKARIKVVLRDLATAETVVANLQRKRDDLIASISEGN